MTDMPDDENEVPQAGRSCGHGLLKATTGRLPPAPLDGRARTRTAQNAPRWSATMSAPGMAAMTDDPVARLKSGLGADEHFATVARLPQKHRDRMLREVAAKREILGKYEATEAYCRDRQYDDGAWAAIIARDTWKQAVLALATAYGANDT